MKNFKFINIRQLSTSIKKNLNIIEEKFQKKPYQVEVNEVAKWICCCGQSKKYPYCDGSHKLYNNGQFKPMKIDSNIITEKKNVYVCGCGYSQNIESGSPFCDGTHKKILDTNTNPSSSSSSSSSASSTTTTTTNT